MFSDLTLNLFERHDGQSGVKKISFFTDFWLINKTGLRLLYRQQAGLGASEPAPGQVAAASDDSLWDLKGTYHHHRRSCFPPASRARFDTHTPPGEPRDWFFKDQLAAADKPLPFSLTTGLERKKQIEVKVLRFQPPSVALRQR